MRISIFGWLPSQGIGGSQAMNASALSNASKLSPRMTMSKKRKSLILTMKVILGCVLQTWFPTVSWRPPTLHWPLRTQAKFFFWFAIWKVWKQNVKKWLLQNCEFVIIDCDFSVLSTLERSNQKRRRGNILCKSITVIEPDVEAIELLDHSSRSVQTLPLSSWADNLQLLPGRELLLELLVHLLGQLGKVFRLILDKAKGVLGERVKHVQAVDLISLQAKSITIFFLHRALQYYQYH